MPLRNQYPEPTENYAKASLYFDGPPRHHPGCQVFRCKRTIMAGGLFSGIPLRR
jgi:hypothetical protein